MNKKTIALGASFAVGGVLLATSAYANAASSSGYEVYKSALKNMTSVKSSTSQIEVEVQDHGSLLAKVDSVVKTDRSNHTSSGMVDVKGASGEQTVNFYNSAGKLVVKNAGSDVYKVIEQSQMEQKKKAHPETERGGLQNPYVERVVDALVGNIRNNITLQSGAAGSEKINLQLTENQIPALGQAVAGLVLSQAHHAEPVQNHLESLGNPTLSSIVNSLPKLTDNIKIENINWSATVNSSNQLQDQNGTFEITGQDASGKTHDLLIHISINQSNLNHTTPDSIDLTGKQVQVIQPEKQGWHK